MTRDQGSRTGDTARLRVLFVNRMASMERGGGETFDLEMARHLARMRCEITFLSGIPLFGRARRHVGLQVAGCRLQVKKMDEKESFNLQPSTFNLSSVTLRAPMFPWFPWDRVKGGWRVRVAEFWLFEKLAARWAWKHRNEFDIIQVCELPTFVTSFKRLQVAGCRLQVKEEGRLIHLQPSTFNLQPKLVLRLTAPNVYDPSGGVQKADAVIASGTTVGKIRAGLRSDCEDVPNAVDVERFQVAGEEGGDPAEIIQHETPPLVGSTFNLQPSTCNLLYVARFQDFKRHDVLIRAFAHVLEEKPDSRLILVGSGPLERQVKKRVQMDPRPGLGHSATDDVGEVGRGRGTRRDAPGGSGGPALPKENMLSNEKLDDAISFMGEVPYEQVPGLYASADIKVISSDYESFCFSALEAMASGLPIVSTDCGWVPILIGDTFPPVEKQWYTGAGDAAGRFDKDEPGRRIRRAPGGVIVGRNDPESLSRAILELAQDEERRKACGHWNREKAVREHGWETSARKLLGVYERVIDKSG